MIMQEIKKDLFEVEEKYVLCHCISLDCAMGSSIAKQFNVKYPLMKKELTKTVKNNNINYPFTILYMSETKRKIFNLITKEKYWHKLTYNSLEHCLKELKNMCYKFDIIYLAMSGMVCGLDKLKWTKVKTMIENIFQNTNIEILICYR